MRASSPSLEQAKVGVVPRNPESVTSSTVSPIERTRVALVKDTTINASYSSEGGGQKVSLYIKTSAHKNKRINIISSTASKTSVCLGSVVIIIIMYYNKLKDVERGKFNCSTCTSSLLQHQSTIHVRVR